MFYPFSAADRSLRGDHPAPLARFCPSHAGHCGRFFNRAAAPLCQDRVVVRRLDFLRRAFCSPVTCDDWLRADRRPLRIAFSAALTLLWGITFLSQTPLTLMNLFCVGLSHHTANVETRERFVGHAAIDRDSAREVGCAEALLPHHLQSRRSLCRFRSSRFRRSGSRIACSPKG